MMTEEKNELFHEYKGVEIYHVYRNDRVSQGRRFFGYTLNPYGCEAYQEDFDIRTLVSALRKKGVFFSFNEDIVDEHRKVLELAIDHGIVKQICAESVCE
jgi:hypothetical protein